MQIIVNGTLYIWKPKYIDVDTYIFSLPGLMYLAYA